MTITQHFFSFIITAALSIMLTWSVPLSSAAEEVVDPHWTGKHCAECHVAEKIPELRFEGDIVKLCNRCHQNEPPECSMAHPENSFLPEEMKKIIPAGWPLSDSKMTCITCHEVRLQMHFNEAVKKSNVNFLRISESADLTGFCFNCHQKELFQKTNPHKESADNMLACFRCHTEGLTTGLETCFEASLKTKSPALCVGCHWKLTREHVAHAVLGREALKKNEAALHKVEEEGIELPLQNGRMHCATCHNPHPKGFIGRKEAAVGAEEKYFLRIPGDDKICLVCHTDKPIKKYMQQWQQ